MKKLLLFVATTVCLICSCEKDQATSRVNGVVQVERTKELVTATTVELCDLYGLVLAKTITDDNANYEFDNLSRGFYLLKVTGEEEPYVHVFKINSGENKRVDIIVHRIEIEMKWKEFAQLGIAIQSRDIGRGTWESIKSMCEHSTTGDLTDWRLPTIDELTTIYLNRNSIGGFTTDHTYNYDNAYYWADNNRRIDFADGGLVYNPPSMDARGRCVRTLK